MSVARSLPLEASSQEVARSLAAGERVHLVDCREPHEHAYTRLDGAELIPMNAVRGNLSRLDAIADDARLVVYCHHGVRSLHVVHWLREQGIENCQSMHGGIDQWSVEVDPSVPRY